MQMINADELRANLNETRESLIFLDLIFNIRCTNTLCICVYNKYDVNLCVRVLFIDCICLENDP